MNRICLYILASLILNVSSSSMDNDPVYNDNPKPLFFVSFYNPQTEQIKWTGHLFLTVSTFVAWCPIQLFTVISQAKINENLANYFFKTKANNKCYKVLKWTCKGLQRVRAVKSKPKAYLHFIVDPVLKIYETFYKQAKSLCCSLPCFILRHAFLTFVCNLVPTRIWFLKIAELKL